MKTIIESEMCFGEFDEFNLFYIEDSHIYKKLGPGIKTVEFILKKDKNKIVFLEAKKSCPNPDNRYESKDKNEKFEEYYSSITEKFISSFQIYLSVILKRKQDDNLEVGDELKIANKLKDVKLKFILVIKNACDVAWLAGPKEELNNRLITIKKIWGIDLVVLNEDLARKHKFICDDKKVIAR